MATIGRPGDLSYPPTVRGRGLALCENRGMKRARKWSADNKSAERHLDEQSGPLRRRKALRHLDSLALAPERELNPAAATAHVRVLGEPEGVTGGPRVVPRRTSGQITEAEDESVPEGRDGERRLHGHRVLAVPIDQPLSDSSEAGSPEN